MKYIKPAKQPRSNRGFVAIGFNDASTNFHVQFNNYEFDDLLACISDVTEYNNYKGSSVAKAFEKVKHVVHRASFGREGSPVLYLHLVTGDWTADRNEFVKKTPEQMAALVREVKTAFSRTYVDEFMTIDEAHQDRIDVIRLWWD